MAIARWTRIIGTTLGCVGMLLPGGMLRAAQPAGQFKEASAPPQIRDVALAADGSHGDPWGCS